MRTALGWKEGKVHCIVWIRVSGNTYKDRISCEGVPEYLSVRAYAQVILPEPHYKLRCMRACTGDNRV